MLGRSCFTLSVPFVSHDTRLLEAAVADTSNVLVHDRALFYHRLLHANPTEAARVVNGPKMPITSYAEEVDAETADRLFDVSTPAGPLALFPVFVLMMTQEYNSFSVVFEQPSFQFVKDEAQPEEEEG